MWNFNKIVLPVVLLLVILSGISLYSTMRLSKELNTAVEKSKEDSRPADIDVTVIGSCDICYNITSQLDAVKKLNVNVVKEKKLALNSGEARELMEKYSIEKFPAIIIFGEIDKLNIAGFEKIEDALVLTKIPPPYLDRSGKTVGLVSLIYLKDDSCKECTDLVESIANLGMFMKITKEILVDVKDAPEYITKYRITKVPTIVLQGDFSAYGIDETLNESGTIETDGSFVLRDIAPPYKDLLTKKIVGLIDLVYLTDEKCIECYDVNLHKSILTRLGFKFAKEELIDIESANGKSLVEKYKIEKAPTFIMTGDIKSYPSASVLNDVGTFEGNAFVFRNLDLIGDYKDLKTGELVKLEESTTQPT